MEITDRTGDWEAFLRQHYENQILRLSVFYPSERSITVSQSDIVRWNRFEADSILEYPENTLEYANDALIRIAGKSLDKVHLRISGWHKKLPIRDIRSSHIGRFITCEGIIKRSSEIKPKVTIGRFSCKKCGAEIDIEQSLEPKIQYPDSCSGHSCDGRHFTFNLEDSVLEDYQVLAIQEFHEEMEGGEYPQSIEVILTDDIVGKYNAGDRVIVNGIVKGYMERKSGVMHTYLEASFIEGMDKDFQEITISPEEEDKIKEMANDPEIFPKLFKSISPTIYGHDAVKQAISLQLFGGVAKQMSDGTRIRGDIHILLVGDPGIAKSQMIKYVCNLSPRSIYTSGKGTTSAGLTATAVRDDTSGNWTLEAGALVLADNGIAAVDELDKMRDEDRSALHEAMEAQEIHINKAGINASLKTRCALLAAANPSLGRFDPYTPISEQIDVLPSLLSRFDLIFILTDKAVKSDDEAIAKHILRTHEMIDDAHKPPIDIKLMRKYIAYARKNCKPKLTEDAKRAFEEYYIGLRQLAGNDKPMPITARQLEALVRLGEASSRTRLCGSVTGDDAARVIGIVDRCLRDVAYDPNTSTFDIDRIVSKPKPSRDMVLHLRGCIKNVGGGGSANRKVVVEEMIKLGYEFGKTEQIIDKMIMAAEIVCPRDGLLRLV